VAGHGELPVHMPPLVEWPEIRWAAGGRHGGTVEQMPADAWQRSDPTRMTRGACREWLNGPGP